MKLYFPWFFVANNSFNSSFFRVPIPRSALTVPLTPLKYKLSFLYLADGPRLRGSRGARECSKLPLSV